MEIESNLKRLVVHKNHTQALENSYAALILTEWDEFKHYDWDTIANDMEKPAQLFDGRNVIALNQKFHQYYIGK